MAESFDVVVVGGGVIGASTAWHLASKGAGRVLLLEGRQLATGGTGRSTAIVRTHYQHEVLAAMALDSRLLFERFADVVGGDCGFRKTGFLVLNRAADRSAIEANVAMHKRVGIAAEVVEPGELARIDPRLDTAEVGAAAWEPDSGHADPHGTTVAFAAAARRGGASVRVDQPVLRLAVEGDRAIGVITAQGFIAAGTVVVAAGFATRALLLPLGFDAPVTPVRHAVAVVRRTADFGGAHPIVSDRVLGSYYVPEGRDMTLIGTTAPFDGQIDEDVQADRAPAPDQLEAMAGRFARRFPGQDGAELGPGWTGVYDCSPDLQPLLGPVPGWRQVQMATGFSGHGFKLSPVVGEMLAGGALGQPASRHDIAFFDPGRFAAGRPIAAANTYSIPTLG